MYAWHFHRKDSLLSHLILLLQIQPDPDPDILRLLRQPEKYRKVCEAHCQNNLPSGKRNVEDLPLCKGAWHLKGYRPFP